MTSNKAVFQEKIAVITQNMRSDADQDKASSARTASKETIERNNARATEAHPKAGTPETEGKGNSPGGNGDDDFHFQMETETIQERVEVCGSRVNEKEKLGRYVEGLKDEIRTVVRVVTVDGRYTAFFAG
jgi:hypothetical protein